MKIYPDSYYRVAERNTYYELGQLAEAHFLCLLPDYPYPGYKGPRQYGPSKRIWKLLCRLRRISKRLYG